MLPLISFIAGILLFFVPSQIGINHSLQTPTKQFKKNHPDKKWVYYLLRSLPVAWLILYVLVIVPISASIEDFGRKQAYLLTFLLGGGAAFIQSLIEIATQITIVRAIGAGKSLRVASVIKHTQVQQLGLYRLGLFVLLAIVPLLFI